MSVRLRETIKKIRRNLSLRTLSKDDRKSDEDDDDRAKVRDANLGGRGFWSRHRIGSSSGAAKFSISADAGLDRLPAAWPAVAGSGSLGGSPVRMPAPTSDDEDEYDGGEDEDEMHRSNLAEQVEAARSTTSIGSGADSGGSRVSAAADDRLLLLRRQSQQQPETRRTVTLNRAAGSAGFGFVAGGQRPMTVRTVDQGGPSEGLLLPGDQIVEVNGVNAESLPQSAVLELIRRDGDEVHLTVRQPPQLASCTRSILRGNSDEGRKLRKSSSRVRFSEAIQEVDADEHSPAAMQTFQDDSWTNAEPQEPTLKIYLENNQTKTVQFDESTTVEDLLRLLLQKLEISAAADHFALVIREPGFSESLHFRAFSRDEPLVEASSAGGQCSLRLLYAPKDPYDLLKNDEVAFDYLYKQCCNDLMDDKLLPDACASQSAAGVALRLASLFMLEHALIQGIPPSKVTAKKIDKEFGLRTFVMPSLAATISPKILHRKLDSFFKLNRGLAAPGQKRVTALQARLHFMQIAAGLPLFCARRFAVRSLERDKLVDMTLLIGPNCGVSRAVGCTFQRMVQLEDVHDLKITNPPEDQYNGLSLKLVEFKCGNQIEVARLYMREALAYDFCTFLNSYNTTLTGTAAANPIYLKQTSQSHVANSNGYGRLTSNSDIGDVFLPPADYDEAENSTDVDDGDGDVSAVNSALAAAFDDLDDGLLFAEARESTVGAGAILLTAGDATFGADMASGDSLRDIAGDAKYGRLRLGPAGPSAALSASCFPTDHAAVLASGALTKHDEEIGIQMSAIDAATSSDGCRRGDDESGIDSDSEDSGNETLNSVDTNSSFAPAEAAHRSERLSPSRALARGRRGAADRASECVPVVSTAAATALPHRRPSAERRPAPGGGGGASLTRITFGTMAHSESIIGADADDVSTEDDDEDEDAGAEKEKATTGAVNGSGGVIRVAEVAQPVQNRIPIFVGTSREESDRTAAELLQRRTAVAAAASASEQKQRARPSDLRLALSAGAEQRVPGKRPVSDGLFVGEHWREQSSAIGGDAARSSHRLVRQDAIESALASPPLATPPPLAADSPSLPTTALAAANPSTLSKARGARSATVASSSRLAQAFMKLSASSKASGSYDFCPATPPRIRPISAPFNIRSTAHDVLASAKPVRASLSDARQTWGASDGGSRPSSASVFRVPRPSCPPPPPPPPPLASGIRDGAAERDTSVRTPTTSSSSGGSDADAAPSALWAAATQLRTSETITAVRDAEPRRDDFRRRSGPATAIVATTSPSADGDLQRPQRRPQSDLVVITGGSRESSPHERRRSVGAQFTVRSSSGLSLRAVADADSVSYKLDSHLINGGSVGGDGATSPQAASNSAVAGTSPQTKNRVLARILDALKPRKKSASLSRAASAIELTTATGGKGSSLPRWLGNAPKQRPSILSKPRESSITLLRATSYGGCDGGAEREEKEEEELFGSLGDAWPVGRLNSLLPAAEICAIDTTATSQRETWSRSCVLETFLAQSPAVAVGLPAPGNSIYPGGDPERSKSDAQAQQIAAHSDADLVTACGSTSGRPPTYGDANDCHTPEQLTAAAAAQTHFAAALNEAVAASIALTTSREARAPEAIDWSSKTGLYDCRVGPDANEGNSHGDGICNNSISGSAAMSPSYDTSTAVAIECVDILSKETRLSEQMEQKEVFADVESKPFIVEHAPVAFHIQCVNTAVDVDATAFVDEEVVSQDNNDFATVLDVNHDEVDTVEADAAAAAQHTGSPKTPNVTVSQVSLAAMMSIALTATLEASGNRPPNDAAQACAVVEMFLEALKDSGDATLAGSSYMTSHVGAIEWGESQSASPAAASVAAAAAAVQRLLHEAQRMVGECKQMVAAIARRQRNVASSSSGASGKDADSLREEERCCVMRSFDTFTRLMAAAAPYAAAIARAPRPESAIDGWNQHTSTSLLRDRLLMLGQAYATALRAAVPNPSPAGHGHVTEMGAVDTGTSQISGIAAERSESRTDSDVRAATAVAESSCSPAVGGSDEAVRRLMTIATELATALGGLIRLLRQGPLLPAHTTTSGADEV